MLSGYVTKAGLYTETCTRSTVSPPPSRGCTEMASRHCARSPCIQITKTATVHFSICKRDNTKQFHKSDITFRWSTRRSGNQPDSCRVPAEESKFHPSQALEQAT
ncbi:hypothetical protein VPH35_074589 [Triticum aestivum]